MSTASPSGGSAGNLVEQVVHGLVQMRLVLRQSKDGLEKIFGNEAATKHPVALRFKLSILRYIQEALAYMKKDLLPNMKMLQGPLSTKYDWKKDKRILEAAFGRSRDDGLNERSEMLTASFLVLKDSPRKVLKQITACTEAIKVIHDEYFDQCSEWYGRTLGVQVKAEYTINSPEQFTLLNTFKEWYPRQGNVYALNALIASVNDDDYKTTTPQELQRRKIDSLIKQVKVDKSILSHAAIGMLTDPNGRSPAGFIIDDEIKKYQVALKDNV